MKNSVFKIRIPENFLNSCRPLKIKKAYISLSASQFKWDFNIQSSIKFKNFNFPQKIAESSKKMILIDFHTKNPKEVIKVINDAFDFDPKTVPSEIWLQSTQKVAAHIVVYGGGIYNKMLKYELLSRWCDELKLSSGPESLQKNHKLLSLFFIPRCKASHYYLERISIDGETQKTALASNKTPSYSRRRNIDPNYPLKINNFTWVQYSGSKSNDTIRENKNSVSGYDMKIDENFCYILSILKAHAFSRFKSTSSNTLKLINDSECLDDIYGSKFSHLIFEYVSKYKNLIEKGIEDKIYTLYHDFAKSVDLNIDQIFSSPPTYKYFHRHLYTSYGKHVFLDDLQELNLKELLLHFLTLEKNHVENGKKSLVNKAGQNGDSDYSLDPRDFYSSSDYYNENSFRWVNTPLLNLEECLLKDTSSNDITQFLQKELIYIKETFNKISENAQKSHFKASTTEDSNQKLSYIVSCIEKSGNIIHLLNFPNKLTSTMLSVKDKTVDSILQRFHTKKCAIWPENDTLYKPTLVNLKNKMDFEKSKKKPIPKASKQSSPSIKDQDIV